MLEVNEWPKGQRQAGDGSIDKDRKGNYMYLPFDALWFN